MIIKVSRKSNMLVIKAFKELLESSSSFEKLIIKFLILINLVVDWLIQFVYFKLLQLLII